VNIFEFLGDDLQSLGVVGDDDNHVFSILIVVGRHLGILNPREKSSGSPYLSMSFIRSVAFSTLVDCLAGMTAAVWI
jgi:hypothetical protein